MLRPLEKDDLEQVAALFLRVVRPGSGESVADTAAYFQRTTLEHPWADPAIPPLVFIDNRAAITAFLGSYLARMRFDGEPIRAACPGNLVAAPEARGFPPGALLFREYLSGPQDLTFVDTLGTPSRLMWKGLGGEAGFLGAVSWIRVFRPFSLAGERLLERRAPRGAETLGPRLAAGLDAVARKVSPALLRADPAPVEAQTLDPGVVVSELPRLARSARLRPDYDQPYLEWLFDELSRPRRRGTLVRRVIRAGDRVAGWYL